jgi:hypothetical protein
MSKFKKILKIAAPIIGGLALGPMGLGLSSALAGTLGGAAGGLLSGGGLKSALLGGLGGYVGGGGQFGGASSLGSKIGSSLGVQGGVETLNRGIGGAISGASQGGKGALTGALLGGLSANTGDIAGYVGGKANELGDFVDRNLGTNIFRPAATGNPGIDAYNNVINSAANPFANTEYGPQSIYAPAAISGTEPDEDEVSGTSTDAGGAQTGAKSMKFSDVLSGVNDYYAQDQMQKEQMDALKRAEAAYSPYMTAGGQGLNELMRGYNPADLTQDPSYQFRLAEGQKALEKSLAARGMLGSGQAMKAITDYGQNMASTAYDDAYRNWFMQNSQLAGYGNQNLGNMANIYGQMGDAGSSKAYTNNSFLNALLAGQYGGF